MFRLVHVWARFALNHRKRSRFAIQHKISRITIHHIILINIHIRIMSHRFVDMLGYIVRSCEHVLLGLFTHLWYMYLLLVDKSNFVSF